MSRLTLQRAERLRNKIDIEHIFVGENKSFITFPLRVIYIENDAITPSHTDIKSNVSFLISVSKKKLHHAVDRNHVKRQIREAWRLRKNSIVDNIKTRNKTLSLAFIYIPNEIVSSQVINKCMDKVVSKLLKTNA